MFGLEDVQGRGPPIAALVSCLTILMRIRGDRSGLSHMASMRMSGRWDHFAQGILGETDELGKNGRRKRDLIVVTQVSYFIFDWTDQRTCFAGSEKPWEADEGPKLESARRA